jgi:hypothetical protein
MTKWHGINRIKAFPSNTLSLSLPHRWGGQYGEWINFKGGNHENEAYWGDYFFSDFPFVSISISLGSTGSSHQS